MNFSTRVAVKRDVPAGGVGLAAGAEAVETYPGVVVAALGGATAMVPGPGAGVSVPAVATWTMTLCHLS